MKEILILGLILMNADAVGDTYSSDIRRYHDHVIMEQRLRREADLENKARLAAQVERMRNEQAIRKDQRIMEQYLKALQK